MKLDCGCCTVRTWLGGDAQSLARHANNEKIARNLRDRFPHPYTLTDAEAWIALVQGAPQETSFAIDVDGTIVGSIGLMLKTDIERISAETGYWLGEEYWGRGILTAVLKSFTPWACDQFGLIRLFATPFTSNVASRRVLVKAGYSLEGTLRRAAIKNGVIHDLAVYSYVRGAEEY